MGWEAALQAFGTLAGAWGQYETSKEKNKVAKQQLDYEKQKDSKANAMNDKAQANLDGAFADSTLNVKKKKKDDGTIDPNLLTLTA